MKVKHSQHWGAGKHIAFWSGLMFFVGSFGMASDGKIGGAAIAIAMGLGLIILALNIKNKNQWND